MKTLAKRLLSGSMLDAVALLLGVLGSISSAAIFVDRFYPSTVVLISITVTLIIVFLVTSRDSRVHRESLKISSVLYFLMTGAVALFLRWGPYRFEQGGQDQGLYVNMATTLSRWGSVRFPDQFRQSLDSAAQAIYDQTHLASYYLVESSKSLMTIEFYPLHPALMAIAQTVFGVQGTASLTVISMLGVWGGWHLALEIDGRRQVANLFALLIAINPALVFFARFPVSESVALTFVIFGMLYFIRFIRSTENSKMLFYLLISLASFNSLFYVRWQFLLYVPFFLVLLGATIVIPSYQEVRNRISIFVTFVFLLFGVSMAYYMKKQPELYTPVRNSITDMFPDLKVEALMLVVVAVIVLAAASYFILHTKKLVISENVRKTLMVESFGPRVLALALLLAIPSVISLYAGKPMYPWGYRVPADVDSWVIRYHVLYRIALFASPPLLLVAVFGSLRKPLRNRTTGVLSIFTTVCLIGILMRPAVPYLYYYGRYLIVDFLPAIVLLGVIILVTWMSSRRKIFRFVSAGLVASVFAYSAIFSAVLIGRHEGEDSGFYSSIAQQISNKDVVIVSSTSQQVIVPLRAKYQLNILAIPDPSSGFSTRDVFKTFENVASQRGGRLLYLVPHESAPNNLKFVDEFTFTDRYFTNTDHFRGDGLLYLRSRRRLLLPTRWQSGSVTWQLFEINLQSIE